MADRMKKGVLVTGADAGLGLSLVKRFLQGEFAVFAGIYHSDAGLNGLAGEYGDSLALIPLDVADMDSVREAARQVAERISTLDIVINNAGIHLVKNPSQSLEQLDFENQQFQQTMDVNAFGPLRVLQQFQPFLENSERKLIINISSEAGSIADCRRENQFAYCMSKAALNMQSKILQNYLRPRGFKVLAVHPGWMRTNMGGPDATLSADESAEGIFQLALREWKADDPIYVDYQGVPLPW
jgi:NAD(P)-dependent dehydrogenase (short-subunit alcohol dehydrogenase family)